MEVETAPIETRARPGWTEPKPARVSAPTYQSAVMGLGIAFGLFGLVTSYAFSAAGLILFVFSLSRWIGELVHDE